MAAVITLQSSSAAGPAVPSFQQQQQQQPQSQPHSPDSQPSHRRRLSRAQQQQDGPPSTPLSPVSSSTLTASAARAPGRDGPSCDACLRRKSRCAMNEMVNKCYSCDFHRQECTFNLSSGAARPNTAEPLSKKRKLEDSVPEDAESVKRYVHTDLGCINRMFLILSVEPFPQIIDCCCHQTGPGSLSSPRFL